MAFATAIFGQPSNGIPPLAPASSEIPPTFWEQYGTAVAFASVVALVILGIVVWWLAQPKPVTPQPPEVVARRALEVLRQRNEDGAVLSEVSQTLRRYLVAAFELPREEMPTAEFCSAIQRHEKAGVELSGAVTEFLRRCDEQKFSPLTPTTSTNAAARALELVERGEVRRAHVRQLAAELKSSNA
jgi:hypothetical protein